MATRAFVWQLRTTVHAARRQWFSTVAQQKGDAVTPTSSSSPGFALPREAEPLRMQSRLSLYASASIEEIGAHAMKQLYVGTGLAASGFSLVVWSLPASVPPAMVAMACTAGALNLYALWVLTFRSFRRYALRHVEEITILPFGTDEPEASDCARESVAEAAKSAATMEERLAATQTIPLEIRTATTEHWVELVPKGTAGIDGDLASFSDVLNRLRLLHVDIENGTSADAALLKALTESTKVAAEERALNRTDVGPWLRVPDGVEPQPLLLTETRQEDVERVGSTPTDTAPSIVIEKIGNTALYAGCGIFVTGMICLAGEKAKDEDGVPRWINLRIPGLSSTW
eukprot:5626092-Amphidinium_carterae.1